MDVIQKVKKTIRERGLFSKGSYIVAGFSGGPDSLCMLSVLAALREELSLTIFAVHVNHQLRGEAADQDQTFSEQVCEGMKIPCNVVRCDVAAMAKQEGCSTEDAGRRVRYQAFFAEKKRLEEELEKQGASAEVVIAVAQNQNDQAETVLMRLMRGTGLDGLAGIEYKRKDGVIRPLLEISRKEIEKYCEEQNLQPRIDHTNLQAVYTRNRIRLELIPYIEKYFNPSVNSALTRLAKNAAEDASFLNDEAENAWNYCREAPVGNENKIISAQEESVDLRKLRQYPPAIRKRILLKMLAEKGLFQNVSAVHLEQADELIKSGTQPSIAEFPNGYRLKLSYDRAQILKEKPIRAKNKNQEKVHSEKEDALKGTIKEKLVKWDAIPPLKKMGKNVKAFDYEALKTKEIPFVLRTRKAGDFIRPLGMSGTKKLKNYFIDRKIPSEERDHIPLVACGSEIIWIVGETISESYKVTEKSEVILLLEYEERI